MTALDIFALLVLLVLAAAVVGIWVILGMLPGANGTTPRQKPSTCAAGGG
jgi:hypothetical protein